MTTIDGIHIWDEVIEKKNFLRIKYVKQWVPLKVDALKLAREAKYLENVRKMKIIDDMDRKMNESCQKCKNELVACVCMGVDDD